MKITLIVVGKTSNPEMRSIFDEYARRINRYLKFEEAVADNSHIRLTDPDKIKHKEGELILKKLQTSDYVILLDENGKNYTSEHFARWLEGLFNRSTKNICFVVGGAYGFSDLIYERANARIRLSDMTFSHQIIRPVFAEQLYRAFTIINNEPYHHS